MRRIELPPRTFDSPEPLHPLEGDRVYQQTMRHITTRSGGIWAMVYACVRDWREYRKRYGPLADDTYEKWSGLEETKNRGV